LDHFIFAGGDVHIGFLKKIADVAREAKDVITVAIGNCLAQIFSIARARVRAPTEFGDRSVVLLKLDRETSEGLDGTAQPDLIDDGTNTDSIDLQTRNRRDAGKGCGAKRERLGRGLCVFRTAGLGCFFRQPQQLHAPFRDQPVVR
jgi:hypothetical protein